MWKWWHAIQTLQNSALRKWNFHSQQIPCSEYVNFALKNYNGALNRPSWILRSENENSALKKWKFCAKIKILCSESGWKISSRHGKLAVPALFRPKLGSSEQFYAVALSSRNYALNSATVESRKPGGAGNWRSVQPRSRNSMLPMLISSPSHWMNGLCYN